MPKIEYDIEQTSDEWFAAKVGKPSASNASRLITSTGQLSKSMKGYAQELAGDLYANKSLSNWAGNAATDFGKETEDEARFAYEMRTDSTVQQVGFIEDDLQRYLISPDGLIDDNGLVEIKCKPKLHLSTLMYYKKNGKIPTDYIPQLQMQLCISEREWVDIWYYSRDLPSLKVRIYPDDILIKSLQNQLALVLAERDRILQTLKEF